MAVERRHGRHPPADGAAQAVPVLARRIGAVTVPTIGDIIDFQGHADPARRHGFDFDDVPYEA